MFQIITIAWAKFNFKWTTFCRMLKIHIYHSIDVQMNIKKSNYVNRNTKKKRTLFLSVSFPVIYFFFLNSFKWPSIYNLASNNNVLCIEQVDVVYVLCVLMQFILTLFSMNLSTKGNDIRLCQCALTILFWKDFTVHTLKCSFDSIETMQISFYADELFSSSEIN